MMTTLPTIQSEKMSNSTPIRFKIVPYEYIVSESIRMFIENHEHLFVKQNSSYIFTQNIEPNVAGNILLTYMNAILQMNFSKNIYSLDTLYFIVDDCFPHMNWRSNDHQSKLSAESKKFVKRATMLKYLLKERDIKIDELHLNNLFELQFERFFRDPSAVLTQCGFNNIIFFRNIFMSYNDVVKTIELVFGKYNVDKLFHRKADIKHTINTNELIYKDPFFKKLDVPEQLKVTTAQIIDIIFMKIFNVGGGPSILNAPDDDYDD